MAQVGSRIPEPSKGSNVPSRLQQMQVQFQRKLQEEKDGKMGSISAPTSLIAPSGISVRQFFAQRRAAAQGGSFNMTNGNVAAPKHGSPVGWDKSYPLSPIKRSSSSSGSSSGYESIGKPPQNNNLRDKRSPTNAKPPVSRRAPSLDRRKVPAPAASNEMKRSSSQILAGTNTKENNINNNYSYGGAISPLKPTQLRANKPSPPPANVRRPPKWSPTKPPTVVDYQPPRRPQTLLVDNVPMKPKSLPASKVSTPTNNYGTRMGTVATPPAKTGFSLPFLKSKQKQEPVTSSVKEKPKYSSPPDPNMAECSVCGRRFNKDRIKKHEDVCLKTATKKRKIFDPAKMRVKGTELEEYMVDSKMSAKGRAQEQVQPKKSDWRQKRAGFIEAMRQAKMVQKHLAAGGKVSDLPPPPPMDTSDYIQCPHCNRKFAAGAAERHIPKCQNIRSNKK